MIFEVLLTPRKSLRRFFFLCPNGHFLLLLSEVKLELISVPEGTSCPQESKQFTHFLAVGGDGCFCNEKYTEGAGSVCYFISQLLP